MTLVITNCTNRKRKPVSDSLHISSLPHAGIALLAADWGHRLKAESERFPASDIYGGRGYQEAAAAARALDARMLIVSAGLGLINASTAVPPYACTVLAGAADSVRGRVTGPFSMNTWWSALRATSPFAQALDALVADQPGAILVALSDAYLDMLAAELIALPVAVLERVRIFTRAPEERIAEALRPSVMPYDDRLDGPDSNIRGTRSDFASRALRHFVRLGVSASAREDRSAVADSIANWRLPSKIDRVRHDDDDLLALIHAHWEAAGGSSSKLLRVFRDDLGIACEQSRFAVLARQVREERA